MSGSEFVRRELARESKVVLHVSFISMRPLRIFSPSLRTSGVIPPVSLTIYSDGGLHLSAEKERDLLTFVGG